MGSSHENADIIDQTLTAQGILNDTSMERDICNKLDDIDERMSAQFKMLRDTINMLAEQLHRQHVDFMEKMDKIIEALQEITESLRDLIRALRESNSTFTINVSDLLHAKDDELCTFVSAPLKSTG